MRASTLVLVVIALAAAAGTAHVGRQWLAAQQAQPAPDPAVATIEAPRFVQIMVAAEELPTGTLLRESHVAWRDWPEDAPAQNYFLQDNVVLDELLGSVVRSAVAAGEPVSRSRLVQQGERGFLAAILTPGMRAVSVQVTAITGIAGLVMPGDRVDLLLTHPYSRDGGQRGDSGRATTTVMENLRVLATDQRVDHQGDSPAVAKTVTLEVSARQAQSLAVANELGQLSLALRSIGTEEEEAPAATIMPAAYVNGHQAGDEEPLSVLDSQVVPLLAPPPKAEAEKRPGVAVIRGTQVSVVGGEEES